MASNPDLAALPPSETIEAEKLETPVLVDTIIERYHRTHSRELPELIEMAGRVEEVHRGHPSVPVGLAALLKRMLGELTIHMQKEELILFPLMKRGGQPGIENPIMMMMAEHEDHDALLHSISDLTHGLRVPEDGCGTWRALYAGLAKLSGDLTDHIHTENTILFPRFLEADAA